MILARGLNMIYHDNGKTIARCEKCRCKALFDGELADKRVVAKIKKQGWKMTDTGHYCGRCAGWKLGTS